jgi:thioredoxin reductase
MIRTKCRCCDDEVFAKRVTIVGADEQEVWNAVNAIPRSSSLYVYYDDDGLAAEAVSADAKANSTLN